MYYINNPKQEPFSAKTYERNLSDVRYVVDGHLCHTAVKFGVLVDEDHSNLPTFYLLL